MVYTIESQDLKKKTRSNGKTSNNTVLCTVSYRSRGAKFPYKKGLSLQVLFIFREYIYYVPVIQYM